MSNINLTDKYGNSVKANLATGGNPRPALFARIPVSVRSTGEKDTGWDFPDKGLIQGAWVDVKTAEVTGTTKTIDVGLLSSESGGDADGLLDGVSTAATGLIAGVPSFSGSTGIGDSTQGDMLYQLTAGSATDDRGAVLFTPYVLDGAPKSLTYTLGSAATELDADIVVQYVDLT